MRNDIKQLTSKDYYVVTISASDVFTDFAVTEIRRVWADHITVYDSVNKMLDVFVQKHYPNADIEKITEYVLEIEMYEKGQFSVQDENLEDVMITVDCCIDTE